MTRQNQFLLLITLIATSMIPSYWLQGWFTSGESPTTVPFIFLHIDAGAWALRAIIEPLVLAFLFSTPTDNATVLERKIVLAFEVSLIALITFTLGPTLGSNGLGNAMSESLSTSLYWFWNFGVASYAPLMLGATGVAFKIEMRQQTQTTTEVIEIETQEDEEGEATEPVEQQEPEPIATSPSKPAQRKTKKRNAPKVDKETATLALFDSNGATLRNAEIATALKESPSTTSRRLKKMVEGGALQQTADGFAVANGQPTNS